MALVVNTNPKSPGFVTGLFEAKDIIVCDSFFRKPIFILIVKTIVRPSLSRCGLETGPTSLFYLFVRVYADLCTVKTMNFWYNETIVQ